MKLLLPIKIILFIFLLFGCASQKKTAGNHDELLQTINKNFSDASAQYKVMMTKLPANRFPKTYSAEND